MKIIDIKQIQEKDQMIIDFMKKEIKYYSGINHYYNFADLWFVVNYIKDTYENISIDLTKNQVTVKMLNHSYTHEKLNVALFETIIWFITYKYDS